MQWNLVWQQHISKFIKYTVNKLYFVSLIDEFVEHLAVSCDGQKHLSHIINIEHTEKV